MRKTFIIAAAVFWGFVAANPVWAELTPGMAMGVSLELNRNTKTELAAAGGFFNWDLDISRRLALGGRLGASQDQGNTFTVEGAPFIRCYLLSSSTGKFRLFLQADLGVSVIRIGEESELYPLAGGTLGFRLLLGQRLYMEPYVRGGYPFMGGAGFTFGYRL